MKKELIERLKACNSALESAAWNYSRMTLEDLDPAVIESTGVAETCLIEVRNNNTIISEYESI